MRNKILFLSLWMFVSGFSSTENLVDKVNDQELSKTETLQQNEKSSKEENTVNADDLLNTFSQKMALYERVCSYTYALEPMDNSLEKKFQPLMLVLTLLTNYWIFLSTIQKLF